MLGHLEPRFCHLTPQTKQHYQHLYCSICYSLRQQFGLSASFFISHELTLSLAAFPSVEAMTTEKQACPAKLFCKQKTILRNPLIDKAAQLCLLLVWLKVVDWETDEPVFYKKHFRQQIEHKIQPILANLAKPTRQFIDAYLVLIRANNTDFMMTTKMSGLLARHVFQELSQDFVNHQHTITDITLLLGELITVADALLDLEKDIKNKQYNPIIAATQQNQTSLEQEYVQLKTDYDKIVLKIVNLINSSNLSTINPLFSELLQQSLHHLAHKIQSANNALFADSTNNRENNSRREFGCCDDCINCLNCCDCCFDAIVCCK